MLDRNFAEAVYYIIAMASKPRIKSTDDIEFGADVNFCVRLKLSLVETLKHIESSDNITNMWKKAFVYKWHEQFREGRYSVLDDNRHGQSLLKIQR